MPRICNIMGNRVITIDSCKEKSEKELVDKWKKLCLSKYGFGGIKKRILELIKEDLKKSE